MFFKNIFFNSNDYTTTDKKIKNGTFGTVHIINNKFDHLEYCAKFLHIEENTDQNEETILIQEFYTQSTLIHPSIVKILGINFRSIIDLTRYQPIILTKYYKNGSLRDIFEKRKRNINDENWTITKRYIFILGVVDAMKYIHDHDILHIDLKPENILIDENYFPKVCDFGLSICFPKLYYQSMKSNLNNSFYLPPEMILDNGYGKGVDVYAFSMIAYELLTDKEPYFDLQNNNKNPSLEDLWKRICQGTRPKFTENVPEKMIKLISQCWSQNPEERPSFSDIFQQLTSDLSFYPDEINREEIHEYISKVLNQPNVQIFDKNYQRKDDVIELLFKACESDDVTLAKEILSNPNFDVNKRLTFISHEEVKETTEKNALHVAIEKQKYKIVELLLSRPEIDVNAKYTYLREDPKTGFDGSEEKTALHIAINKRNLIITKLLLNHPGIDVNAQLRFIKNSKDKISEKTALHLAIEKWDDIILRILLGHPKINVNAIYRSVSTGSNSNYSSKMGKEKEVICEKTALYMLISFNEKEKAELLLNNPEVDTNILYREIHKYDCSEPKDKFDPTDTIERTALYLAAYKNNIQVVRKLLSHSKTNPNIFSKECFF